jgi:Class II flagellar assembly regulator
MKIDRLKAGTTSEARRGKRAGASKSGEFSKMLSSGDAPAGDSAGSVANLAAVGSLLALQETQGDPDGDTRGRRRGEDLLDRLDELRLALLEGRLSVAAIERLADLVAARRAQVSDPRLAEILDEIELRAAVELAKLGR